MMKKQWWIAIVVAGSFLVSLSGTAMAGHEHWLDTPGTCVADIPGGQTVQTSGGGFHQFHIQVHTGTPGTFAFQQEHNPVSIGRDSCPSA